MLTYPEPCDIIETYENLFLPQRQQQQQQQQIITTSIQAMDTLINWGNSLPPLQEFVPPASPEAYIALLTIFQYFPLVSSIGNCYGLKTLLAHQIKKKC